MKKLGYPTLFCNTLEVADNGEITGYRLRIEQSKLSTVKALQSVTLEDVQAYVRKVIRPENMCVSVIRPNA